MTSRIASHVKNDAASSSNADGRSIAVELVNVSKWYGDFRVLQEINLTVRRGEPVPDQGNPYLFGKETFLTTSAWKI
ncbi:ABC-type transporter Mla maintaining outer membrane lipid asymmetry ATPase subunit MlaF [Rhizobium tropici]|uniref:ABC-type transporter Mla maintaining outer membrane lipid asymmetry ATPase subunit MlaF n=1 Tax=Rhizobium tropici TaxID=398 RepID=A0ABR6R9A8_RHITR|nr:ABC-type transporter Mla maintaining outer membrane lipid asymmetry ATPase subunit MlaF [Rhizobium tropici]MBB5596728.1 ABC-type transporter Mla maintaining outer membrane lipid asymmetry ATPase subunit MlaF [Rhizobium tropici]MBB6495748.1 ABC-type transporter Mla maintaining outer membrane lipid asymmetry ATPase subunit MlaF [Rhizobium tropici]